VALARAPWAGVGLGLLQGLAQAQSGTELARAAEAVVALSREGGPGAALAVGRETDALLLLTAAHVLGPPGNETRYLRARLKGFADRELTRISVLQVDRKLDLAALRIGGLQAAGIDVCKLPVLTLNADLPVRREHAVFAVGNPAGVAWAVPPTADRVSEVGPRELRFQSAVVDIGHSGGGLFNVFGDLVGMIRADQPPWGVALRVGVLTQALSDWRIEAGFGPCGATHAAPAPVAGDTAFKRWIAKAASSRQAFSAATDYQPPSPASLAVFDNDMPALERLAASGAALEQQRGLSPLMWAVALGRRDMLRYLLLKGVRLNTYDGLSIPGVEPGRSEEAGGPLHMASRLDDADAVRLLTKAGADLSSGGDITNGPGSPLTVAAAHNAMLAAKALIAAGADSTEDRMGWDQPFPLLAALNQGNLEMLKLLRAAGARLSIRVGNTHPATLLSLAAEKAPVASIRWLIQQKVPLECRQPGCESPLYVAVRANRVDVIQVLIKAGASPTGDSFEPYLCLAVKMDNTDALKALLLAGANPAQAGQEGTPLAMARRDEKKEMVDALLAHGARR
jgi:ankyrin repeat protein